MKAFISDYLHEDDLLEIRYEIRKITYAPISSIRSIYQDKHRSGRKNKNLTYKGKYRSETNNKESRGW